MTVIERRLCCGWTVFSDLLGYEVHAALDAICCGWTVFSDLLGWRNLDVIEGNVAAGPSSLIC